MLNSDTKEIYFFMERDLKAFLLVKRQKDDFEFYRLPSRSCYVPINVISVGPCENVI